MSIRKGVIMNRISSLSRKAVAILSALMLAGIIAAAIPASVQADYIDDQYADGDPNRWINNGETMRENHEGGTIGFINYTGILETNNGAVYGNSGTVVDNNGYVNADDGTVVNNNDGGTVNVSTAGYPRITNNCGGDVIAETSVRIENYYSGDLDTSSIRNNDAIEITNSYSDSEDQYADNNSITVANQYHSLDLTGIGNVDVNRTGFVADLLDTNVYVKTAENKVALDQIAGTITIAPKAGYKITDRGLAGEGANIAYTLTKNNDGSYTVTLQSLSANLTLTPADLNLIIARIGGSGKVTVNTDDSIEVGGSVNNQQQSPEDDFDARAVALIMAAPAGGSAVVPGLSMRGLSPAVVAAMLARTDETFIFTYDLGGVMYQVIVPAGSNLQVMLNAAGGIDFASLIGMFGSSPM